MTKHFPQKKPIKDYYIYNRKLGKFYKTHLKKRKVWLIKLIAEKNLYRKKIVTYYLKE